MDDVCDDTSLSEKKRAIHFRDALIIGFLIARPVRKRALLAMDVDTHLVVRGQGFSLHFPKEGMKDGRPRDYPFPEKLTVPMQEYLDVHRPILLGTNGGLGLWINQYGNRFAYDGFTRLFGTLMETHLGCHLRPHRFRDIAATSIAEFDPVHVGVIRDILGHATLDMAEKHYNRASQVSSCNALQSLHEKLLRDYAISPHNSRTSQNP
ncbi:phage integrase family protein [Roseovarius sp. A-2]|nr:phage integrase family protein [Roseovarius sp. A-2]